MDRKLPHRRTIYLRQEDADLWDWAEAYCKEHRVALSALLVLALEAYRRTLSE